MKYKFAVIISFLIVAASITCRVNAAGQKGDITADELFEKVSGTWYTGNSSADRKQFVRPYVLESVRTDEDQGYYELKRVSLIESIDDTPDGEGYNYILNTGTHYYLYPDAPDVLECHWEPDGYSGSDSLVKGEEEEESSEGNTHSYFDMSTYTGSYEVFQGRISRFTGYGADGSSEECLALNLNSPIRVLTSDGRESIITAIQLSTEFEPRQYIDEGVTIGVKGTLFEAHTDHHFTPVLIDVDRIK